MKQTSLVHEFVDTLPATLQPGVVYVSIRFATVAHLCCCGCGEEVVTPLSPARWQLGFDGRTISLYPSIGSWTLPCRSHYWIRNDSVRWAEEWSDAKIARAIAADRRALEADEQTAAVDVGRPSRAIPWWRCLIRWPWQR